MIPLSNPILTEEMKEAAVLALQNERFVLGESVFKFEEEFARYIGTKEAVSVNSGTFAITAALLALKLTASPYIATTAMSFAATANAIVHANLDPVFYDIEEQTGNMQLDSLQLKQRGAIVPVHLYGNPCDVEKLREFEDYGIPIIEDACQAHGATHGGQKVGSFGDVGCFSFYPSKNMTVCGDGGMVTTDSQEIAIKIRNLRDCGRLSKYVHTSIGYTARLNTVNAAIGRVQLKHLDEWNNKRRQLASVYEKNLPKEVQLDWKPGAVFQVYVIKIPNRDKVITKLSEQDIESGLHYPIPVHLQSCYINRLNQPELPISEKFAKEVLSLPMSPSLSEDQVKYICEIVI